MEIDIKITELLFLEIEVKYNKKVQFLKSCTLPEQYIQYPLTSAFDAS